MTSLVSFSHFQEKFQDVMNRPISASVGNFINTTASHYQLLVDSLPCKALLSLNQLAKSIEIFTKHLFSQMNSLGDFLHIPNFHAIKEFSSYFISETLRLAANVKSIVSFISLKNLKKKLIKHIENAKLNYSKGDIDQFTTTVVKIVATVSSVFGIPRIMSNFINVFGYSFPSSIVRKLFIPNIISCALFPSKILTKVRACNATHTLLNKLTTERLVFLQNTRGEFKTIQYQANIRFLDSLNEKLTARPEIVNKIFKVNFQKNDAKVNFFEKLTTEKVRDFSNSKNLNKAVKAIQSRLEHRVFTNRFSIIAKSISFGAALIGQLETLGIPCNPISPFKITIEGGMAILSFGNLFYQRKKQKEFISTMERLTE